MCIMSIKYGLTLEVIKQCPDDDDPRKVSLKVFLLGIHSSVK